MFKIPAGAMKDIVTYMQQTPIEFRYPHIDALTDLTALIASQITGAPDQRLLDFINYVNTTAETIDTLSIFVESLAAMMAEYNESSEDEEFEKMLGSFTPQFIDTFIAWTENAQDNNLETIFSEMESIKDGEPAAIETARKIKEDIANAMRLIRQSEETTSPANAITQSSMSDTAKNAIATAQKAIAGLQQLANFGFANAAPGQEFKSYLEGITKDLQGAVDKGLASLTNGALNMDGLKIPAGIVDAMKTAFPEVGKVLNQIQNVKTTVDTSISQAAKAIQSVRNNIG